jgi:hypothetical protein
MDHYSRVSQNAERMRDDRRGNPQIPQIHFVPTNPSARDGSILGRNTRSKRPKSVLHNRCGKSVQMARNKSWGSYADVNREDSSDEVSVTCSSNTWKSTPLMRGRSDIGMRHRPSLWSSTATATSRRQRRPTGLEVNAASKPLLDHDHPLIEQYDAYPLDSVIRLEIKGQTNCSSILATFSPSNKWNVIRRDLIEKEWLAKNMRRLQSDVPCDQTHFLFIPEGEILVFLGFVDCQLQISLLEIESAEQRRFIIAPLDAPCSALIGSDFLSAGAYRVLTSPTYFAPCDKETITAEINGILGTRWDDFQHFFFEVSGDFQDFLEQERSSGVSVRDVITLTGSSDSAWACTCSEYLQSRCPDVATPLLNALDGSSNFEDGLVSIRFASKILVDVKCDNVKHLAQVGEALGWMCAVFRPSTMSPVCTSTVSIYRRIVSEKVAVGFHCHPLRAIPDTGRLCWNTMFPGGVLAQGFPIRIHPEGMRGLEISFGLMAHLSGVEYPVFEDNKFLLKGYRTMLEPVAKTQSSVQWHFDPEYGTNRRLGANRSGSTTRPSNCLSSLDEESILDIMSPNRRHFLALWRDAKVTLGTSLHNYSDVKCSKAPEMKKSLKEDAVFGSFSLSAHGFANLIFGKSYKVFNHRKYPYANYEAEPHFEDKLLAAQKQPVILYSPSEESAWMVSSLSVLLHLTHTRATSLMKQDCSLVYRVPYAEALGDGGQALYDAIKKMKNEPAVEGESESLKKLINRLWFSLDSILFENTTPSSLTLPCRIFGYEFHDLACARQPVQLKQHKLGGVRMGWVHLLDGLIKTIFYEGIPNSILPNDTIHRHNMEICSYWQSIPPHFNFLTASVPCLKNFREWQGFGPEGSDPPVEKLSKNIYWHSPENLFEDCDHGSRIVCKRTQELHREGFLVVRLCAPKIKYGTHHNGAVLFKYSKDPPRQPDVVAPTKRKASDHAKPDLRRSIYLHKYNPPKFAPEIQENSPKRRSQGKNSVGIETQDGTSIPTVEVMREEILDTGKLDAVESGSLYLSPSPLESLHS